MSENDFPYTLDDVSGWTMRRKDGTIIRYTLLTSNQVNKDSKALVTLPAKKAAGPVWSTGSHGYSAWCTHEPYPATSLPIFESEGIALRIADAVGARKVADLYDVAIDGGNALSIPGEHDLPFTYGDPMLVGATAQHVNTTKKALPVDPEAVRILKIRWFDREAPPVQPEFWQDLLGALKKLRDQKRKRTKDSNAVLNVLTICQGGHGRSGTAMAALIMLLTDYTPLDVLTHIRALHCSRAIESKDQHLYLDRLAKLLGREENALSAEKVSSFKNRFLELTSKWAAPYQDRVRDGKGAKVEKREAGYL